MTLALITGSGGLPPLIVESLAAQGRTPLICEMIGVASDVIGDFDRVPFRIETLGTFLQNLSDRGVSEVCMAGVMHRPDVDPTAVDAATAPLVPRLMAAMTQGDDGTLREVVALFEEHGFTVRGAHELAPELLPMSGVSTKASPPDLTADLAAAEVALADMGRADLGQAMLLREGAVIAREDARGTAAMLLDFCAPSGSTGGAVLFKAPKPDQILQADMPVIGPDTAKQAAEAGLSGIVIPAGKVMVLDLTHVVAVLDAHDMFLWVRPAEQA